VRRPPPGSWPYTDDSQMAWGIASELLQSGRICQDAVARRLADDYRLDPLRAYGGTIQSVLRRIGEGVPWQTCSAEVFSGMGSHGNGAAVRAGPVGAYFADDQQRAADEARRSAAVTHGHPEGVAGAIAVALAAAWGWRTAAEAESAGDCPSRRRSGSALLEFVAEGIPPSDVRSRIRRAETILDTRSIDMAVSTLGNGSTLSAVDTVPFALWCVARHLDDYEGALWEAVSAGGDRDTIAAIVGSVVTCGASSPRGHPPRAWVEAAEPLPPL